MFNLKKVAIVNSFNLQGDTSITDYCRQIIDAYSEQPEHQKPELILVDTTGVQEQIYVRLKKAGLPVMRLTLDQLKQIGH